MGGIEGPGKETKPEAVSANRKLELWGYNANLVLRDGENIDMDLLNENRSFIHAGKFLQRSKKRFKRNRWTELFALLFDNYLVLTEPEEEDGVTKYQVYQRPIALELLTLGSFTDPPIQRGCRLSSSENETRTVYPCAIHRDGRLGGLHTLFVESAQARLEWKARLEEAIRQRKVVQESNKVFEVEFLNVDTSPAPTHLKNAGLSRAVSEENFMGQVTCSVPFNTTDGRRLVAIGCAEGVWVGLRHDSRFVRVLHLPMVTQCAVLEDFGFFLVLADKVLYAYHIEALVPSSPEAASASKSPRRLSRGNNVKFFASGNVDGRTLVIYMGRKNYNSVFKVLEPVTKEANEKTQPLIGSMFGLWSQRQDWFRVYREFFLPDDSFDVLFMKSRVVILCSKGFEVLDLADLKSVIIPVKKDPRLERVAQRIKSCRPIDMVRLNRDEFLLCYNEFGLYVNKHGDPSRTGTIEWEGAARRVVWYPPYIFLFNDRFIEIRHALTGRLVQIIPGNNVRCIWDNRGLNRSQLVFEGGVYGVLNVEASQTEGRGSVTQRVFELVPAVPLSLPELISPSHASELRQSDPSPLSSKLNSSMNFDS